MTISRRRVRAVFTKEIREYRRTGSIVGTMAVIPLVFVISPMIQVFALPLSAATSLRHEHLLLYMLAIPALVPGTLAAYSIVGERGQGTLEPMLTTPIRREEFLLGKTLAAFVPSVAISYLVYAVALAIIELFARRPITSALIRPSEWLIQLVFTPLMAGLSIWIGTAISARMNDVRSAQQLSALANLPLIAVSTLVAYGVIHPPVQVAIAIAAGLVILNRLGWRVTSAAFDRERLVTRTQ